MSLREAAEAVPCWQVGFHPRKKRGAAAQEIGGASPDTGGLQ